MASKGNTWQKKLVDKQRRFTRKVKGVKSRFAIDGVKIEAAPRKLTGFCNRGMFHGSEVSPLRGL